MRVNRVVRIAISAFIATGLTVGVYLVDAKRLSMRDSSFGLRWARQVADQAEGLALAAKNRAERDPVGRAAEALTQSAGSRVMQVTRAGSAPGAATERYEYRAGIGVFEYTRVLFPETGTGIRVSLNLGKPRFLGMSSRVAADLWLGVVFLTMTALVFFGWQARKKSEAEVIPEAEMTPEVPQEPISPRIDLELERWRHEAKALVVRQGTVIRDLLQEARKLSGTMGQSSELIRSLRAGLHSGINELRDGKAMFRNTGKTVEQAEAAVLNLMITGQGLGPAGQAIAARAEEVYRMIRQIRTQTQNGAKLLESLEVRLEPWATDADLVHHAQGDLMQVTAKLEACAKESGVVLVDQAKLFKQVASRTDAA